MTRLSSELDPIDPRDFPHLAEFARGYLHQDVIPEHGSAMQATKAYLEDLSPASRKQIAAEAFRFRGIIQPCTSHQANQKFATLGAAWNFISKDELEEVLQTLERGH